MKTLQIRLPDEDHQSVQAVLTEIGLDLPTAVRLFLRKVTQLRGLPFTLEAPTPTPKNEMANSPLPNLGLSPAESIELAAIALVSPNIPKASSGLQNKLRPLFKLEEGEWPTGDGGIGMTTEAFRKRYVPAPKP